MRTAEEWAQQIQSGRLEKTPEWVDVVHEIQAEALQWAAELVAKECPDRHAEARELLVAHLMFRAHVIEKGYPTTNIDKSLTTS